MNIKCPHCQSAEKQVKAGYQATGSQRYKCGLCKRRYTPMPKQQGYADELRQEAVRLYIDGNGFRQISRQLGVHHVSVMNWVKAYSSQQAKAPVPTDVNNAEMDELFTFVERKKHGLRDDNG
jgi:transposase-like protein